MSVDSKTHRFKDLFSTSPLPRTFYHPSPAKDVDCNVVIQSAERKDQFSKKSQMDNPFKTGSTFHLSALPQLKNGLPSTHLPRESHDYDDTYSRSEQLSDSTLMNTTHLTSSIDNEKERIVTTENFSLQGEKSRDQDEPMSVIQKYIDRFRYSAPKSREEREKERNQKRKKDTLWWLNSDVQGSEVSKLSEKLSARPSSGVQIENHPQTNIGVKLTREAVLKLDKETSDLQRKADMLLSKSQLSLASSGPCVSTDGLGSSTALSEFSYRSDPQPAYRPIFVNLQGKYPDEPTATKEKNHRMEHESGPNDVLARWRMRRKMEEVQQNNVKLSVTQTQRPMRNHSEIDVRLEEFRKKLLAQRALVTTEDIEFERQKMKMIIDEDEGDREETLPNKVEVARNKKESNQSGLPAEDFVLSRLRKITRASESSYLANSSSSEHGKSQIENNKGNLYDAARGISSNSNNANTAYRDTSGFTDHSGNDLTSLNTNNTALDQVQFRSQGNGECLIDEMRSISICDATQGSFALNSNVNLNNGANRNSHEIIPKDRIKDLSEGCASQQANTLSDQEAQSLVSSKLSSEIQPGVEQSTPYHQRLQAEKPCDDSGRSEKSCHGKSHPELHDNQPVDKISKISENDSDSENTSSSRNIPRKDDNLHNKKRGKHKADTDKHKKNSNEEELSDASSKKSDRSSIKVTCRSKKDNNERENLGNEASNDSETKAKHAYADRKDKTSLQPKSNKKLRTEAQEIGKMNFAISKSPQQNNIRKAIGETVVDHLFDGPSMISSVDSWASLFPQSPSQSHSFYNSTVVTPTKDMHSNQQTTSTPHSEHIASSPLGDYDIVSNQENVSSNPDSSDEFEKDPLMSLLLQQKKEYLRKLEMIESKLQKLDGT